MVMKTPFSQFPVTIDQLLVEPPDGSTFTLRSPRVEDGGGIWRIARDSRVLDTNTSYAYLMWCRDFAGTSVVAEIDGDIAGFVIGYCRPQAPDVLFVWQVAVDHAYRGRGLGVEMLDTLMNSCAAHGVSTLETTISDDNPASIAMFNSLTRRRRAVIADYPLFEREHFPDQHEAERLYRITPPTTLEEIR
ncbi:L-2,4-diaminobutyric acid acetyltransferase [Nocardia otitidiscaviarum]|uniref:L-2,4-diaminobutyric acid acetyltransferase n=1 Tax=Nocardia otitidiscaviarum TaxID=1823 RepID=A0A379JK97_9NOCA|nr:L-2,4-diaminobutyric acid acetyltransferase [Nocardia otitidiscaviarum]